jgi:hypothetical protein
MIHSIITTPNPAFAAPARGAAQSTPAVDPNAQAASELARQDAREAPGADPAPTTKLTIEFDTASERFVQTLVDASNETVLRRYPNSNQLAFSRGINAYMRAMQNAASVTD